MQTFLDQVNEMKESCHTNEEWEAACQWLVNVADEMTKNLRHFENALLSKVGEKEVEEYMDVASDYIPEDAEIPDIFKEMFEYGYTNPSVIPCEPADAESLYNKGWTLLLLYQDNTERPAKSKEDLEYHISKGGMYGVTVEELERRSKEAKATSKEV